MLPPDLVHVVLSGPRHPAALHALARVAAQLRARGCVVATPLDMARRCGALWGSFPYAREAARTVIDSDAVLLMPAWETCEHATACQVQAETLRLPVLEYDPAAGVFVEVVAA